MRTNQPNPEAFDCDGLIDLTTIEDLDVEITDYEVEDCAPGSSGSWSEPAYASSAFVEITEIACFGRCPAIKPGDQIRVMVSISEWIYIGPEDDACHFFLCEAPFNFLVKSVTRDNEGLYLAVCGASVPVSGDTPPQSEAGRG